MNNNNNNDDNESTTPTTARRRGRASRVARLRKHQEVDHVRVSEAWTFQHPDDTVVAAAQAGEGEAGGANRNSNHHLSTTTEAAYITATVQNRRYYGLLVQQEALQAASLLYWRHEASGLDLNRRMHALQQATTTTATGGTATINATASASTNTSPAAAATAAATPQTQQQQPTTVEKDPRLNAVVPDCENDVIPTSINDATLTITTPTTAPAPDATEATPSLNQNKVEAAAAAAPGISDTTSTSLKRKIEDDTTTSTSSATTTMAPSAILVKDASPKRLRVAPPERPTDAHRHTAATTTQSTAGAAVPPHPPQLGASATAATSISASAAAAANDTNEEENDISHAIRHDDERQVQQFSYHADGDYRLLLATYANVAAAGAVTSDNAMDIYKACQAGGGFVGQKGGNKKQYYYQYERLPPTLTATTGTTAWATGNTTTTVGATATTTVNTTLGLHDFLRDTPLPPWYPLSNFYAGASQQQLFLESLGMTSIATAAAKQVRKDGAVTTNSNILNPINSDLADASNTTATNSRLQSTSATTPGAIPSSRAATTTTTTASTAMLSQHWLPMAQARAHYHVIILGAGIAGLSAASEILKQAERTAANVQIKVTVLEGRNRVGGRLWTDKSTFSMTSGNAAIETASSAHQAFPVDLGAGWIHGIDMNPLAQVARQAGVDFVTASEEVTMLQAGTCCKIDDARDERAGKLFDQLLDWAVEDCWKSNNTKNNSNGETNGSNKSGKDKAQARRQAQTQAAVRWYGSVLKPKAKKSRTSDDDNKEEPEDDDTPLTPAREPPAAHRVSDDVSVDQAIGRVLKQPSISQRVSQIHDQEQRMLLWNLKNVEYALGANVRDLSMRYWDIDERHAFEGDHVLLRQGYSSVLDYMLKELQQYGSDRFELITNATVTKVEYARKTMSIPYFSNHRTATTSNMIELSDTCRVATNSEERPEIHGDFVVCALPLGVLKEALNEDDTSEGVVFDPPLPFPKQDAIRSVGFGLLNKIYMQFSKPFWRLPGIVDDDTAQFGNASSCHPHHYMFFDVGKIMASPGSDASASPAILMTLISGHEAVEYEQMKEAQVLENVLTTLRTIFENVEVPQPTKYKITKWGSDKFSRGSYTYLPPGCTDQDFHVLQAPINGNGDSTLLETAEIYRVFFAGEHTTALHPSMAHGAMLSGYRAAKEVVDNMTHSIQPSNDIDRTIPLTVFRHQFPEARLVCSLCGVTGSTVREGSLLAFKRGPRAILVHNNCAEFSPEVEVVEGVWRYVFEACHRGKDIPCSLCGKRGATIGCSADVRCQRSFHFSCAEDTGFRFETDAEGKQFICDLHRRGAVFEKDSRRISVQHFAATNYGGEAFCCKLCGISESPQNGELLGYQQGARKCLVHKNCAKYTSLIDLSEDSHSRVTQDYRNIFTAIDLSQACTRCNRPGATIGCSDDSCQNYYHFLCAAGLNWNFERRSRFRCPLHRQKRSALPEGTKSNAAGGLPTHDFFHHALFTQASNDRQDTPANQKSAASPNSRDMQDEAIDDDDSSFTDEDEASQASNDKTATGGADPMKQTLSSMKGFTTSSSRLVGIQRTTIEDFWNLSLSLSNDKLRDIHYVSFAEDFEGDGFDSIEKGEILLAINGIGVGSPSLQTLEDILLLLRQEVELLVEVQGVLPEIVD